MRLSPNVSIPNRDFGELQSRVPFFRVTEIAFQSLIGILVNCNDTPHGKCW